MNDSGPGGAATSGASATAGSRPGTTCVPRQYRLGPYASADDATRALETVEKRNAEWDAEDARWTGEVS